jgi:hypothetical protein
MIAFKLVESAHDLVALVRLGMKFDYARCRTTRRASNAMTLTLHDRRIHMPWLLLLGYAAILLTVPFEPSRARLSVASLRSTAGVDIIFASVLSIKDKWRLVLSRFNFGVARDVGIVDHVARCHG